VAEHDPGGSAGGAGGAGGTPGTCDAARGAEVTALETLLVGLVDTLPSDAGGPEDGVRVEISAVDLAIPVETHVDGRGVVRASLARTRLATGYDAALGLMTLRYERTEAA
jgi:hypothetical protein